MFSLSLIGQPEAPIRPHPAEPSKKMQVRNLPTHPCRELPKYRLPPLFPPSPGFWRINCANWLTPAVSFAVHPAKASERIGTPELNRVIQPILSYSVLCLSTCSIGGNRDRPLLHAPQHGRQHNKYQSTATPSSLRSQCCLNYFEEWCVHA